MSIDLKLCNNIISVNKDKQHCNIITMSFILVNTDNLIFLCRMNL